MNNITLENVIERYNTAIADLESAGKKLSSEQILEVLIARDAVQAEVADKTRPNPGHLIRKVNELDKRLKQNAESIDWSEPLTDLQSIFNPPKKDWWWLLDPITPKPWRDRYDWLWRFLSLAFLTASLSLTVETSTRFLSSGPDTVGVFAVIIPSVLTLLTGGGALTKTGQEAIEYILTSLKIDKHWWDEAICLVSGLLLVLLGLCWYLLPCFAVRNYVNPGNEAYSIGQYTVAENNYNRALKIDPTNTQVYYKLGLLYGELEDFDKALEKHKIAFKSGTIEAANDIASLYLQQQEYNQADKWLWKAVEPQRMLRTKTQHTIDHKDFNTLIKFGILDKKQFSKLKDFAVINDRQFSKLKDFTVINDKQFINLKDLVYIYLKKEHYSDAYRWLDIGLGLTSKNDNKKQAPMLAYLGWIRLKQELYEDAKPQLQLAISRDKELASAHCLLAQVLEKQKKAATTEWEQCLSYASQYNQDESTWIGLGIKYLNTKGRQ